MTFDPVFFRRGHRVSSLEEEAERAALAAFHRSEDERLAPRYTRIHRRLWIAFWVLVVVAGYFAFIAREVGCAR